MKAYLAELVTMIDHDNKGSALDSIEMNIADGLLLIVTNNYE